MRKFLQVIVLVCIVLITAIVTHADELDDITKQLASLNAEVSSKESDKANVIKQINGIRARVTTIGNEVVKKEKEVAEGEKNLVHQKKLLDERARSYYKNINKGGSAFIGLLIGENFSDSLQNFFYQKVVVDEDRNAIVKIVLYIKNLEDTKQELVEERKQLAEINKQLDRQTALLEGEIASARSKVAQLTTRQQELIASRISGLHLPRSAGSGIECVDDRKLDPGFGSGFAFYTYGIPHRVGMSQYGAYGRASRGGQDYKTILNAYFQNMSIECRDVPGEIQVDGFGAKPFEEYVKGVVNKEMGADIPEALKAQAIAARSFALSWTNNGASSICASEDCQVYTDARRQAASDAVDATGTNACGGGKAEVMVSGGQPIKAWFASTFGGFAHTSAQVWGGVTSWTKNFADTSSGVGSFSDLQSNAWDNESKCFYTAQGSRQEYGKSAWLQPSEVADIANTLLLVKQDSSTGCFLYQTDKAPPSPDKDCPKTDNWSRDKVRGMVSNSFNNITNVRVSGVDFGGGNTTEIIISEGGHEERFGGDEWKSRFNLRAPANISIVGPLYNVETR